MSALVVSLVNEVVDAWSHRRSTANMHAVKAAVDKLLAVLLDSDAPVLPSDDIRSIFEATHPQNDFDFADQIWTMAPALVPIAAMRVVQRRHGVDFDPARVPHWESFMDKFGPAILAVIARGAPSPLSTPILETFP